MQETIFCGLVTYHFWVSMTVISPFNNSFWQLFMTPLPTLKRISLESCSFTRGKNNIGVYGLNLKLLLKSGFCRGYNSEVLNIWKSYMWTVEWRIKWRMIIAVIYATFAVAKRKPEMYGIRTLDLCDTGAALYQLNNKLNKLHVPLFWEKGIGGPSLKKGVYKFKGCLHCGSNFIFSLVRCYLNYEK